MTTVLIIILVVSLLFGLVVLFGPPFLPTTRRNLDAALDLLEIGPGETLLDLGSGDGRVLVAAAQREAFVVGIELNPILVAVSWLRTIPYRKQVRIIWGNYFMVKWPHADSIFTFMISRQMSKLDKRINKWRAGRPVKLASFAFTIPDKKHIEARDGVFLYQYK